VNACENTHLDAGLGLLRALENETRNPESLVAHPPHPDGVGDQVGRSNDLN
jgi:hypothetical protein